MASIDNDIQAIKDLTKSICSRIDNIMKNENQISHYFLEQLEIASWEIERQVNDIELVRERFA